MRIVKPLQSQTIRVTKQKKQTKQPDEKKKHRQTQNVPYSFRKKE